MLAQALGDVQRLATGAVDPGALPGMRRDGADDRGIGDAKLLDLLLARMGADGAPPLNPEHWPIISTSKILERPQSRLYDLMRRTPRGEMRECRNRLITRFFSTGGRIRVIRFLIASLVALAILFGCRALHRHQPDRSRSVDRRAGGRDARNLSPQGGRRCHDPGGAAASAGDLCAAF